MVKSEDNLYQTVAKLIYLVGNNAVSEYSIITALRLVHAAHNNIGNKYLCPDVLVADDSTLVLEWNSPDNLTKTPLYSQVILSVPKDPIYTKKYNINVYEFDYTCSIAIKNGDVTSSKLSKYIAGLT